MQGAKDMAKGSITKNLIAFAFPLFLSNLFQQLYNTCDSLIVGNFLGTDSLAAVSSSGNLIFLFTSFFIGTASGAGVVIAKYFGEKNYDKLSLAVHTNIAFGLIAGVVLTVIGVGLSPAILSLMNIESQVFPKSVAYFKYYFAGGLALVMYNVFNGILNALGNSKRSLLYLLIASALNVVLDLLFIAVFKWGVWAAGFATAISQFVSAICCFVYLLIIKTPYRVKIKKIKIDKDILNEIVKYGVPSGVTNSVIGFANVIVQSNINTFGSIAMAGCGTYSKLEGFIFLPINSFVIALTTFVGQNLGAREYERARRGAKFGLICTIVMAETIGLVLYFTIPYLAGLFTGKDSPDRQRVIDLAVKETRTISFFYFMLALSHCISAVLRGAGKAVVPMTIMLGVWCVLRVAYITVALSIKHDIYLVFMAYPITWFISSVIYIFYYKYADWEHGFDQEKTKKYKRAMKKYTAAKV